MALLKYLLIVILLIILNASAIIGIQLEDDSVKVTSSSLVSSKLRPRRQDEGGLDDESKALVCDFGSGTLLELCSWSVPEDSHLNVRWRTGQGSLAYWLGGPLVDKTVDDNSGKNGILVHLLF